MLCSFLLWFSYIYILFSYYFLSRVITRYWTEFPVLYSRTSLFIQSTYNSLHLLTWLPIPFPLHPLGNHNSILCGHFFYKLEHAENFPGGPVIKISCFPCKGCGFDLWELRSYRPWGSAQKTKTKALEHMANGLYLFPKIEYSLEKISLMDSEYHPPKCAAGCDGNLKEGFSSSLGHHRIGVTWPPQVTLPQGLCPTIMLILGNFCDRG